jgi:hypothetical protein
MARELANQRGEIEPCSGQWERILDLNTKIIFREENIMTLLSLFCILVLLPVRCIQILF